MAIGGRLPNQSTPRNRICRSQSEGSGKNGVENQRLRGGSRCPALHVICGANRHDSVMLEPLLAERFVSPDEDAALSLNLCLDTGYVGRQTVVEASGYVPHIRSRGEEKREMEHNPNFRTRRWVVEASHTWLKLFRKLSPRYEKTDKSYSPLLHLAAGMIAVNKVIVICG
ncbi:MAG: transposase [Planctomycetia bacterium]|nr:transposase [Planctomycetia bacterium]